MQRQESGRWVVDSLQKEHNHDLDSPMDASSRVITAASKALRKEVGDGLENLDLGETTVGSLNLVKRGRESNVGSDWYPVLLEYFQSRQAEDTGFFYAVEVDDGKCMSIFWADGRARFSCGQFGDAIIFDTAYRRSTGSYLVPFASFVGINHHRQPVLLGCALVADESEESFTWVFQTWLRAMLGRPPLSITADQDEAIQHSIAQVFPGTHHRFSSTCQIFRAKEEEEQQQYLGNFFAGIIPMATDGSCVVSFFGTSLNAQTPLNEFVALYEKALEQRREEERKEDFNSFNLQAVLQTQDPIEEQGRRLYTITVFKAFQKELLECYSYVGIRIDTEGAISRYLVRKKCGNREERNANIVALDASNLNASCSCKMFEFEGVLCRHVLKVFQMMNTTELPSRYILHRWTKNAKYGVLRDIESGGGGGSDQDFRALMLWSLREEARNFIDAGATSLERCKLAFEIMREGRRNLCWQN